MLPAVHREHVQPEDRIDLRILEHALLDHQLRAALLAGGRAFFGGLKDQLDRAGQLVLELREDRGRPEQDRHVVVVAARVHDADFLAVPLRLRGGLERQIDLLGHRQRVHVRAQRHDRPRLAAAQHRDDASVGHAGRDLVAELLQFVGDDLGGAQFAIAQLGMLVKVAAPGHDLRGQLLRQAIDLRNQRVWRLAAGDGRRQQQQCHEHGGERMLGIVCCLFVSQSAGGVGAQETNTTWPLADTSRTGTEPDRAICKRFWS